MTIREKIWTVLRDFQDKTLYSDRPSIGKATDRILSFTGKVSDISPPAKSETPPVSAGYVTVPVEPTEDMVDAACLVPTGKTWGDKAKAIYNAMLKAAPPAPDTESIPMPPSVDYARKMHCVATAYLKDNDPDYPAPDTLVEALEEWPVEKHNQLCDIIGRHAVLTLKEGQRGDDADTQSIDERTVKTADEVIAFFQGIARQALSTYRGRK